MASISSFEELRSWKLSRELVKKFKLISRQGMFASDKILVDQMYRAAVSIMANLAEGFERNGNKEFRQFANVSKASSAEFRSHLYIAFDLEYITQTQFEELYALSIDISKMISGLITYLNDTEMKGSKFKEDEAVYFTKAQERESAHDFEL